MKIRSTSESNTWRTEMKSIFKKYAGQEESTTILMRDTEVQLCSIETPKWLATHNVTTDNGHHFYPLKQFVYGWAATQGALIYLKKTTQHANIHTPKPVCCYTATSYVQMIHVSNLQNLRLENPYTTSRAHQCINTHIYVFSPIRERGGKTRGRRWHPPYIPWPYLSLLQRLPTLWIHNHTTTTSRAPRVHAQLFLPCIDSVSGLLVQ